MAHKLASYVGGKWVEGEGDGAPLVNPTTEEVLATASTRGLSMGEALGFARAVGGPALRSLGFRERAELLAGLSKTVHAARDPLIELAIANGGNTRSDAKFDLDGATATLSYYAELGRGLGDARFLVDGELETLGRSPRYVGAHVLSPRQGVAVHINAFNFPAWGMCEKLAVALLAGMPCVVKPATSTAMVAARIVELVVEAGVLPPGALSLVVGAAGDLVDHLGPQDVLAFTGSWDTGVTLRSRPNVVRDSVRVNVEADSLNAAVLGPDVESGSETFDMFLREVAKDVTQKAGQKCTAIRRVFVPRERVEEVAEALSAEISLVKVGDPSESAVRMGPLATASQRADVQAGLAKLRAEAEPVLGDGGRGKLVGVEGDRGYFVAPVLLKGREDASAVHDLEVFGPVATIVPWAGDATGAIEGVRRGRGSLVASVYSDDRAFVEETVFGIAAFHGRITVGSARVAEHSPGPGTVLPQMVHGGPGRAGGGEELGGRRGLAPYLQRTAIQGEKPMLVKMLGLAGE